MIRASRHRVGFHQALHVAILLGVTILPGPACAEPKRTKMKGFWVAGSSSVTVEADEAVLWLAISGRAEDSAGALAENDRITHQVEQSLREQGLQGKYRVSANRFISGGASGLGPALAAPMAMSSRPYYARALQPPPGFEVRKYVFVTFSDKDLSSEAFDQILADTIDALTRAGARQPELPPQLSQFKAAGPVLFTVKDPGPALREAVREASERAARMAEEVARNSGVKLGRILDARVNRPLEVPPGRQQEPEIINELHLQYYGLARDAITISATFAAEYSTH